jgi:hypothetical protein
VELEYLSAEHNISCLVGYQNLSPHTWCVMFFLLIWAPTSSIIAPNFPSSTTILGFVQPLFVACWYWPGLSTNEFKLYCEHSKLGLCSCWFIIVHGGYAPEHRQESRSFINARDVRFN